ncbi:MAG: PHP domain-containing protein, partial [Bacillota bacterium]|nr:PHP domain-containing protein [Bacillota bacterium]
MRQSEEQSLIQALNDPDRTRRLSALQELRDCVSDRAGVTAGGQDVNNHIHTHYSFSPYSPAKAVWMAARSGLATAGIMDHDTIAGAREFIEAGRIYDLPTTIGAECRVSFADTPLAGRRINNPDQDTVAYVALHGIPHSQIDAVADYFRPILAARGWRNRQMTRHLNDLLHPAGISLDYDQDIVPLSAAAEGGQVTERHLLYAVSLRLIDRFGPGLPLVDFLQDTLCISVRDKARQQLSDPA